MSVGCVESQDRAAPEVVSRKLRRRYFYTIEDAGLKIGLSRTRAYSAARMGIIPVERYGKLLLVRRVIWDRQVKKLMRGRKTRRKRDMGVELRGT